MKDVEMRRGELQIFCKHCYRGREVAESAQEIGSK